MSTIHMHQLKARCLAAERFLHDARREAREERARALRLEKSAQAAWIENRELRRITQPTRRLALANEF